MKEGNAKRRKQEALLHQDKLWLLTTSVLEPMNSAKNRSDYLCGRPVFGLDLFLPGFPRAWIIVSFCLHSLFCPSKSCQPQKTKKQVQGCSERGHFLYRMLPLEAWDFSLSANPLAHCTPANDKAFSSQLPLNLLFTVLTSPPAASSEVADTFLREQC